MGVRHQKSHNSVKDYVCTICSWTTNGKLNYKNHILTKHESEWTFKCNCCEFTGPTSKSLSGHILCVHERGEPKCHLCNYVAKYNFRGKFLSKLDEKLKMHMKQIHNQSVKFKCESCDYWALNYQLKLHKSKHHGYQKLICGKCGYSIKKLTNEFTMEKHNIYIHEGKPPQCNQCDFVTKHKTDKHSQRQTPSGYFLEAMLRKHMKNKHREEVGKEKTYYIEAPDPKGLNDQIKSMMDKSERRIPGRQHGFLRVCIVCGKEGKYKSIVNHIEMHHINGPVCTICAKAFKNRMNLANHMNKWHKK